MRFDPHLDPRPRSLRLALATRLALLLGAGLAGSANAQSTGQLVITSDPSGAMLSVDGAPVGQATLTLKDLIPGDHVVEARWPDGKAARSVARVVPGSSVMVELLSPGLPPRVQPAPPPAPEAATEATVTEAPRRHPWWVLLAPGIGLLAVGYISSIIFAIDGMFSPIVLMDRAGVNCNSGTDQLLALIPFAGPVVAANSFAGRCDQGDTKGLIGLWAGITTTAELLGVAAIVAGFIIPKPLPDQHAWLLLPGAGGSPAGATFSLRW